MAKYILFYCILILIVRFVSLSLKAVRHVDTLMEKVEVFEFIVFECSIFDSMSFALSKHFFNY